MNGAVKQRAVRLGQYILKNQTTVRKAAEVFHVSKSTVHKDITERLKGIDFKLYKDVQKILEINKQERHIRGGDATRKKYEREKRKNEIT